MGELIVWLSLLADNRQEPNWNMMSVPVVAQAQWNMVPEAAIINLNWSMIPDKAPKEEGHAYRIVILTAPAWCAPCRVLGNNIDSEIGPALKASGWKIGPTKDTHIQIVDIDKDQTMASLYNPSTVPTVLLVDDRVREGHIVEQLSGQVTIKSLTDMYNRTGVTAKRNAKK